MTHVQPAEAPENRCLPWSWPHAGEFRCGCCGHPLFNASDAYDAGTGWPSFRKALPGGTCQPSAASGGTEIVCAKCGAHLGDYLPPAHFCVDGVCLLPPPNPKYGKGCEPKMVAAARDQREVKTSGVYDDDASHVRRNSGWRLRGHIGAGAGSHGWP